MTTDIKTIRDKIAALTFQQKAINAQPRSRDDVEAILTATLARFEATAAENMARTMAQLAAGQPASLFTVHGQTAQGPVSIDLGPAFCSLLGTASMLNAMQAAFKSVPEGLTAKGQVKALQTILDQLDKLQTDEEAIVRQSEADGAPIPRRTGADPRYVLAL